MRPDDGPVQGPKHVVLIINTPLLYYLCFDCTILYRLIDAYTFALPDSSSPYWPTAYDLIVRGLKRNVPCSYSILKRSQKEVYAY